MKLVQLNIWQGKLLKEVIQFLKEQDADIVCLQEVFSSELFVPVLDLASSLEIINEALGYEYVFFSPTFSFSSVTAKIHFGNVILSKLPFKTTKTVFTNNDYHIVEDWSKNHPANTRNALIVEIDNKDKPFSVVCHHGFWDSTPLGNDNSVEAMNILKGHIKDIEGPLLLAGDLNVTAQSPTMRLFDDWLEDLTASHDIADTLTVFGKVRDVPCDHILVSPDVMVNSFEVSEKLVSDHKALILVFSI